jgi:hypothetical protein
MKSITWADRGINQNYFFVKSKPNSVVGVVKSSLDLICPSPSEIQGIQMAALISKFLAIATRTGLFSPQVKSSIKERFILQAEHPTKILK